MINVIAAIVRRAGVVVFAVWVCCGTLPDSTVWAQAPQQQDGFVPIEELPPQEQLPSAPLLVGAYSFVVLALFLYLVSVARRLNTVQREVERLESDLKRSGRA